jgi:archaemetzincin
VRDVAFVPVGAVDLALIDYLTLIAHEVLGVRARVTDRPLSPDFAYDAIRRQHHSTKLLSKLKSEWGSDGTIALGVSELDLFIPILTFVFGEAELGGNAAVISTARLTQSFYGLPDDDRLLYQRAEKEALHELGHVFGLTHCSLYECVMHFSNSVDEVDLKGDRFCPHCSERLKV